MFQVGNRVKVIDTASPSFDKHGEVKQITRIQPQPPHTGFVYQVLLDGDSAWTPLSDDQLQAE